MLAVEFIGCGQAANHRIFGAHFSYLQASAQNEANTSSSGLHQSYYPTLPFREGEERPAAEASNDLHRR